MSETTEACIRGCALYGQHLTDCEDQATCKGCLPRRAQYGHLCHTCHRRLELMLHDAPTVVAWLTGNLASGGSGSSDDPHVTGSRELPLPIKAGIFDERQAICDALAAWADDIAETLGVSGPIRHDVENDCRFLRTWLTSIERLDPIGDWWEELAEHTSNAHALAPWRPPVRRIPAIRCPRCSEVNLVIYGGESDVTCQSCKSMMTENEFWIWENVLQVNEEAS
jgi:hypothetical protein